MSDFAKFVENWGENPKQITERMLNMGITRKTYDALCDVATLKEALIFIRQTNRGSALPFLGGFATGKPLAVKGKSSNKPFTSGTIAFLAYLSKKVDQASFAADQQKLIDAAVDLVEGNPVYTYIPRFIPAGKLKASELAGFPEDQATAGASEIPYSYQASPGVTWQYLLVKRTFAEMEPQFRAHHVQIYPGFQGQLVPSGDEQENFYQVYVRAQGVVNTGNILAWPGITATSSTAAPAQAGTLPLIPSAGEAKTSPSPVPASTGQMGPLPILVPTGRPRGSSSLANAPAFSSQSLPVGAASVLARAPVSKVANSGTAGGKTPPGKKQATSSGPLRAIGPIDVAAAQPQEASVVDKALNNFAPELKDKPDYRAVYILAQGKKEGNILKYYEVVADFDVFCICPSLTKARRQLELFKLGQTVSVLGDQQGVDMQEVAATVPKSKEDQKSYYHLDSAKSHQGFISPFEREIKSAINKALRGAIAKTAEDKNTSNTSKIKGVIHGSEVNNYFYTEDFKPLIFIRPNDPTFYDPASKTFALDPKFALESQTFLDLACMDQIEEPYSDYTETQSKGPQKLPWSTNGLNLYLDYCFFYNMGWGHNFSEAPPDRLPAAARYNQLNDPGEDKTIQGVFGAMLGQILTKIKAVKTETSTDSSKKKLLRTLVQNHLARLEIYINHYSDLFSLLLKYPAGEKSKSAAGWVKDGFDILWEHLKAFRKVMRMRYDLPVARPPVAKADYGFADGDTGDKAWEVFQAAFNRQSPLLRQGLNLSTEPTDSNSIEIEKLVMEAAISTYLTYLDNKQILIPHQPSEMRRLSPRDLRDELVLFSPFAKWNGDAIRLNTIWGDAKTQLEKMEAALAAWQPTQQPIPAPH